ncbi:phospholipid-transporting ATPase ABCA3-like [Haemaphysalis longicornis]
MAPAFLAHGWSAPDSGTITIGQYDVAQNTEAARRLIGYSPDDPVLFSDLTVEEHLVFFAMVRPSGKSLTNDTVRKDASRAIRDMGLTRYRNRCVEDLKAGYRRLLGVTIAMMPFSEVKLLVLDDPTRHMDPRSRREMWEVLFKVRRYKGVFLTTSDYAEAEALADRIAVLVKGQFYCVGSPEYIKAQFGMGYQLRLHKGSDYKADDVESLIQKKHTFPPPRKALDNKGAVVFRLTGDSDKLSITMREIFFALELEKSRLGIDKMGVTVTTLEDVLESVSERRSVPASMPGSHEASAINEPPVVKKGNVAAKGNKAEKIASKMDNDAKPMQDEQIKQDAFANDRLGLLRKQSQPAVGIVATINCLFQKRVMDWTRTVTLRSGRWLLPSALLLLGGYCESLALSGTTTLRTTLTYDMANIVGQSAGFCGATKNGRFQSFVVTFVCPLMQASDIQLEELDVTNAQSQLLDLADEDVSTYVFRYQMGVNPHAALLALNLLHTAILRNLTRDQIATIQLTNAPDTFEGAHAPDTLLSFLRELELSSTRRKSTDYVVHVAIVRLFCAVFVPAALCYHAAHFVALVLGERMSGAKHLQLMTGLSSSVFWLGHFTFDMCLCVVHAAAMAGATALFRPYLSWNFVFAIYMMFITYGGCATCLAYLASFWFENVTKAFYTMVNIYMFGGVIGSLVAAAADMYVFVASSEATYLWLELLLTIPIRWLPTYIVTRGLTKLILLRKEALLCSEGGVLLERYCHEDFLRYTHSLHSCCPQSGYTNSPETPAKLRPLSLSLYSGLFELFALLLEACFCFFAASFLDSDLAQRLWVRYQIRDVQYDPQNQDSINEDVRNEEVLVDKIFNQAKFAEHALVVRNLSKAYGFFQQHFAIETISFTVHHGECIGIVGVIGTGKTSMMGVLGGELFPTSGDAFRPGMSLTRDYRFWIQSVGYVPFGWGLLETLTGREMIRVIALLRGVQDVPRTTARVMGVVELSEPDAVVSTYSVGAKTQLSLALALIAAPKLYLLDLPELDTQSRAIVHRVLGLLRPSSTVVLTCEHLHHYEDVCDRLAIMVAGRIECIGSVKGLSDKYVRGTTVTIYTFPDRKYDMDHQSAIVVDMTEHFSTSSLARCYEGVLEFRLPDTPMGLCEMFDRLLFLKRKHKFHVFYVSETTLDQIFLSLCRKHAAIAHQSPL